MTTVMMMTMMKIHRNAHEGAHNTLLHHSTHPSRTTPSPPHIDALIRGHRHWHCQWSLSTTVSKDRICLLWLNLSCQRRTHIRQRDHRIRKKENRTVLELNVFYLPISRNCRIFLVPTAGACNAFRGHLLQMIVVRAIGIMTGPWTQHELPRSITLGVQLPNDRCTSCTSSIQTGQPTFSPPQLRASRCYDGSNNLFEKLNG